MYRTATSSSCGRYRTYLARRWDRRPALVVCMLNPSRADAKRDDPTILALMWFARSWGYGGIEVINLRSWRASRPADLFAAEADGFDTIGPGNDDAWRSVRSYARCNNLPVLVAWGNNAPKRDVDRFARFFAGHALISFGTTRSGAPIHPAARGKQRIPGNAQPIPFVLEAIP